MRNSFFDDPSSKIDLESRAKSKDAFERWSVSVELGHISEAWAIALLWKLKTDEDENTRTAAINSLRHFTPGEIASAVGTQSSDFTPASQGLKEWKIRTLPELNDETIGLFETVILDILATEGPTPGCRIFRLIGSSVNPNNKYVVSKNSIKKILASLQRRNIITRNDFFTQLDDLEVANFHLTNSPSVVLRSRGTRELQEIPITELREALQSNVRAMRRSNDSDFLFKCLVSQYEISPSEFHVVGRLLEKEWLGLFNLADGTRE